MTVLVTGASGFVGTHLVQALAARGGSLRTLTRSPLRGEGAAQMECCRGGLEDAASIVRAVRGASTVYHLAAVVPGAGSARAMWQTNADGTARLAAACVAEGVRRLVLVSSVAVYGAPLPDLVAECSPLGGVDAYGASKAAGESAARACCRGRVELVIVRPCQIYGPFDRTGYTARLVRWSGMPLVPVAGWSGRLFSLVHVTDVVHALCAAAEAAGVDGAVFNIASEQRVSLLQLADARARLLGRSRRGLRVPLPEPAVRAALALNRRGHAHEHGANGSGWAAAWAPRHAHGSMLLGGPRYDITRARAALGFAPRIGVEQGLAELLSGPQAARSTTVSA